VRRRRRTDPFVAGAVRERLRRWQEERLREAFAEAARDPLFLEDV